MTRCMRALTRGLAIALLAAMWPAAAVQVIDVREAENVTARISLREITRLKVQNARIENLRVRDGQLAIEPDREHNEAFLRPLGGARNISLFVTTDRGTFNLQLLPEDVPSTTLVLRVPQRTGDSGGANDAYRNTIKRYMLAMMHGDAADAVIEEIHEAAPLWKHTVYVRDRRYRWEGFDGEVYTLTNTAAVPIEVREREFHQANVAAVAIERLALAPGESTRVYLMRRGPGPGAGP